VDTQKVRQSSVDWETDVYAKGQQLNRWPYSDVVSSFSVRRANWNQPQRPRVLEIGFGAGNNLWFLASAGFDVCGIDYSTSAAGYAEQRLSELGLEADLRVADLAQIPFPDDYFDFVLDRAALTQVLHRHVALASDEIYRVLRRGGELLSFDLFGEAHPDKSFGTEVEPGSYDNFADGIFKRVGLTSFFSEDAIRRIFARFTINQVCRHASFEGDKVMSESFILSATK
jgi:ubiquinone/menaquinone biosynthesis C-methylase UbiE